MPKRKSSKRTEASVVPAHAPTVLLADVREMIAQAREGVARAVDCGLTTRIGTWAVESVKTS